MALVYIQQNGSLGQSISYTNKYYPSATIATSGCGVCSSLMVLLNSTKYSISLANWAKILKKNGAREGDGTDMSVVCKLMKRSYGFTYTITHDVSKLKAHLKAGYKAVANVGNRGYFSSGGHFVCVAGMTKQGKAIVLDPYYYSGKWTSTVNGINRGNYFTYNSSTHEVVCSFDTIEKDARGLKYFLFTPTKNKQLMYSASDVNYNKVNPVHPAKKVYAKWNGYTTASVLNIREKASTSSRIIGTLKKGAVITVTGEAGDFYAFKYGSKTAYVSKSYVSKKKPSTAWTGVVTASVLNVRAKATTSSKILGTLKRGSKVTCTGVSSGDFYEIRYGNGTAFVSKQYVKK